MKIQFKRLHPQAQIPKQATEFAGGWDVTVTEVIQEAPDFVICKLGFALGVPKGYKLTLVPRSSLTKTKWVLQNSPGLGDSDYTGEYQFRFRALPESFNFRQSNGVMGSGYVGKKTELLYPEFPYKEGDRIGQCYLETVLPMEFEEVNELTETKRGEGGFGSTNK